jgi:DNA invertase Pin-like site-specific DNA recombinase
MRLGYKRVSSVDQNTDRQLAEIELDRIVEDKASGKSKDRPGLQQLISYAREGDVVYVHSLDRLARNLKDLKELVDKFKERKVELRFVKENLVFNAVNNPMSELMLNVLGAIAEFERSLILERQKEGIKIAHSKGKYLGRPKMITDEQESDICRLINLNYSVSGLSKKYQLSRQTIYKILRKHGVIYKKLSTGLSTGK